MDELLRALERQAVTDPLMGGALFIRALLHAGRVQSSRIGVAAYLGHEPSRIALGAQRHEYPRDAKELAPWVSGLGQLDKLVAVRAAIAAAELTLEAWERAGGGPVPRMALALAKDWDACPCEGHAGEALAFVRNSHGTSFTADGLAAIWAAAAVGHEVVLAAREASHAALCALSVSGRVEVVAVAIADPLLHWALLETPGIASRVLEDGVTDARRRAWR